MADDETIRIQVDSVEARAQLAALEKEVRELEAELKTLNSTAGVTNAEIEGTTRRLEEAKAKFAEAGEQVQKFNDTQEEGGKKTQSLADKYVTLGLKVFGARQVLMAAGEAMRSVAQSTGSYSGATKDAIDQTDNLLQSIASLDLIGASKALGQLAGQTVAWAEGLNEVNTELGNLADKNAADEFRKILKAQGDLVQGHEKETDALNLKAGALVREIATQRQAGEIQKWLRDEIEATVKAYEKAGEAVPAPLAAQVTALGITTDAQDKAAESAAKLEEVGVKSAEERAKAEAKAADEVVAALAKQEESFLKMLEDTNKFVAERDKILKAPNAGFDSSQDASKAKEDLSGLNKQIKAIRDSPIITEDQHQQLKDLELQARAASDEVKNLGDSYTIANMNGEDLANKQNAAWEKYYAIRHANDQIVQRNTEKDLRAIGEQTDAVGELGDSAEDAAGSLGDAAEAAGSLGDNAKEGTDKAKEGMDGISEAVGSLTGKLTEAEVVIDRIAVKLAALQLGS